MPWIKQFAESDASGQTGSLILALRFFRRSLGPGSVVVDEEVFSTYARSCINRPRKPVAVLYPTSFAEVQRVIEGASRYSISLYPLSRGKNWGYGSAAPVREENVIVDLSRMNTILEVNEALAYAVIEPGVSQQQLYEHLEQRFPTLMMDVTGSTPDASIVGNYLERGNGHTPYGDHFSHCTAFEAVLGNGQVIRSGFDSFPNAKAASLHRWGIGPCLDGLLSQSNFGIITKMTVWLMPKPKSFGMYSIRFRDDAEVARAAEPLRRLKLDGTIRTPLHILNDLRVLSAMRQFPFEKGKSAAVLSEAERRSMAEELGFSAWTAVGGMSAASNAELRIRLRHLRRELRGIASVDMVSLRTVERFSRWPKLFRFLTGKQVQAQRAIMRILRGIPTDTAVRGLYWRKKTPPKNMSDPLSDACGAIWCAPIIPTTQEDYENFNRIVRAVFSDNNFDVNVSLTLIAERATCGVISIIFDRDNIEEAGRAEGCHRELLARLMSEGYYPYRLGTDEELARELFARQDDSYWNTVRAIKTVLDPQGILAPGRYGIA